MLNKEMTLNEIEKELNKHSDFLKIDMLYRFTNDILPNEQKIFLYKKLMTLYKNNNMPFEAAKIAKNIAMLAGSYKDKEKYHIAEAELYIMSGHLEKVNTAMKDAMSNASSMEKENIIYTIKEFYKIQANTYEQELKRRKASEIYEKVLEMSLLPLERQEIKEKLLELYDKLGKTAEYFRLKNS
ncbi:hypothetical protein KAR91_76125 [Candidatus Pacearchaeota archaeon]|nr:hypothetical protein [Candidatus Pacearchaeota archaeon]